MQTVDWEGKAYEKAVEDLHITGELVSRDGRGQIRAQVRRRADKKYEVTYQPQHRGQHQLHIAIRSWAILNSSFSVTVVPNLTAPTNIIKDLHEPWGIAVREGGDIVVTEYDADCITIISCSGEKKSFGSAPWSVLWS